MPMGLANAAATLMRTVSNFFSDMLEREEVAFMGEVLLYSSSIEEH